MIERLTLVAPQGFEPRYAAPEVSGLESELELASRNSLIFNYLQDKETNALSINSSHIQQHGPTCVFMGWAKSGQAGSAHNEGRRTPPRYENLVCCPVIPRARDCGRRVEVPRGVGPRAGSFANLPPGQLPTKIASVGRL